MSDDLLARTLHWIRLEFGPRAAHAAALTAQDERAAAAANALGELMLLKAKSEKSGLNVRDAQRITAIVNGLAGSEPDPEDEGESEEDWAAEAWRQDHLDSKEDER